MKSIILAAGLGERLRPLTEDRPKCLIDFNGRTFLEKQVEILESLGINDIIVITGYRSEKIREATEGRLKYIHNPRFEYGGTLNSLALAREEFNDDVILISCDVLFAKANLERLISNPEDICLGVDISTNKEGHTNVKVVDRKIVDMGFLEPESTSGAYCGISKFSKSVEGDIKDILASIKEDKKNYTFCLIKHLLKKKKPIGYIECDKNSWCEIDTHEDLHNNTRVINELLGCVAKKSVSRKFVKRLK